VILRSEEEASVNQSSRSLLAFTVSLAAIFLLAAPARADRVVLYPVEGQADGTRRSMAEDHIRTAIRALGHEVVPGHGARPTTAAEYDTTARASTASYVVVADIDAMPGQYNLHVSVGTELASRVEELVVPVELATEDERLRDVLGAMLRTAGLGEDALRLSGVESDEDRAAREAAEAAAHQAELDAAQHAADEEAAAAAALARAEEAERQRLADEERQRAEREAAAAHASEQTRWDQRPLYGAGGAWMLQLGGAAGDAIPFSQHIVTIDGMQRAIPPGGAFGMVQARIGRRIDGAGGLELRAGADVFFGLGTGLDLMVGATYQFSPFVEPIHIGAIAELGLSIAFTGPRDVGFALRAGGVISWNPTGGFYLELALPEIGVMTNGPGQLVFGASLRAGYRFD
jgi:hypothetical protein